MSKSIFLLFTILTCLIMACSSTKNISTPPPTPVIDLKIQSEIPVKVSIYSQKDCTGNWNFCKYQ